MAHLIAKTADGRDSFAFVGKQAWHGLGQALTKGATIEEWAKQAGMNWQALAAPVTYTDAAGRAHVFGEKKILYRSDTGAPISVVGEGFKVVQPLEVLEFFRDLTRANGWYLHTAGVLCDGGRIWAMATRDNASEIVPGDVVRENLLLATGLDGTLATHAGMTDIRVVCNNTLGWAIGKGLTGARKGSQGARVSHRSEFDPNIVKAALGVGPEGFRAHVQDMQRLAQTPCDLEEARAILRGIFGQPVNARRGANRTDTADVIATAQTSARGTGDSLAALLAGTVHVPRDDVHAEAREDLARLLANGDYREQRSVARCLALFAGEGRGATMEGVTGTRWGLLNAVTEHVDHEQGRDGTRLNAAWFGRGAGFKAQALEALLAD
jgi:phage/plasmid-like protein (TIGR03299 family)